MIIVKISDGLGNQMFQYAFGLSIALFHNQKLKIDKTWYDNIENRFTKRNFVLDKLNINICYATESEIKKIQNPKYPILINSLYWRYQYMLPYYKRHFYKEKNAFIFDKNVAKLSKNCYLSGGFQTYKYFEQYRKKLCKIYMPKTSHIKNTDFKKKITSTPNSISVHVRLGDYLLKDSAHFNLTYEYYLSAINYITEKIPENKIFLFSDEPENALKLFNNKNIEVISSNIDNSIEDMYLMSLCKHNIIANSSFSWWAAWLNQNPEKIVIAPKQWFADESINTIDLIPPQWIRM